MHTRIEGQTNKAQILNLSHDIIKNDDKFEVSFNKLVFENGNFLYFRCKRPDYNYRK